MAKILGLLATTSKVIAMPPFTLFICAVWSDYNIRLCALRGGGLSSCLLYFPSCKDGRHAHVDRSLKEWRNTSSYLGRILHERNFAAFTRDCLLAWLGLTRCQMIPSDGHLGL